MIPDTVVVINRSIAHTDYTPIIIGLSAPVPVAVAAGINTYVQRKIADKAVKTQQKLSADAIAVQRETAGQTVNTQLEIARKQNVVQSRREWGRDLRAAVSSFRSVAGKLSLLATKDQAYTLQRDQATLETITELLRLQAVIRLFLDVKKESHRQLFDTVRAITDLAVVRKAIEEARTQPQPEARYKEALKYEKLADAFTVLENQVSALLESNWEKIKQGT